MPRCCNRPTRGLSQYLPMPTIQVHTKPNRRCLKPSEASSVSLARNVKRRAVVLITSDQVALGGSEGVIGNIIPMHSDNGECFNGLHSFLMTATMLFPIVGQHKS